jgi:imidazole glycerol-phosphate synthase subunit HisH
MISIVDYGLGNVRAFLNIYSRLNIEANAVSSVAEVNEAEKLILPGVGSFDWAMKRLNDSGMRDVVEKRVLCDGVHVLGICAGLQIMARTSEEGEMAGLGWIDADVRRFSSDRTDMILPHMGWNDVLPVVSNDLMQGLEDEARFYFLHSYYLQANDPGIVLTTTDYRSVFTSGISVGNVHGVQFHPEKSHHYGIRLLKNFAELSIC